ncbi:flagellar assembly peptidoglycan hydrolase FlgJ [Aromatoleum buckelii]|uniref:Peptidoglycan hydrolase FlgJ n=1 Tax=Aromatoleum buckelii TaxID=200254 RepID=A0ABX1N2G0_9RHOO|nr:flagellar assembly peptidoglycan hydrolase FlgJ [Aromatoleum buckelii]MCK0510895.1 flagellar assembly peptidoglycan hydrolase FlgJ [Aromatoleum buckelii]
MTIPAQINAIDPNALADLKRLSRGGDSPAALRATAKQFEALFLQMVLKSMRDAVPSEGMLDSDQTRLFQAMQDQQTAMNMAQGRGTGLADVIFRQLGGEALEKPAAAGAAAPPAVPPRTAILAVRPPAPANATAEGGDGAGAMSDVPAELPAPPKAAQALTDPGARAVPGGAREFVDRVWPHAGSASRATGIPAHFMVAQAALETGWGRGELRRADGTPSFNLFNIKAGADWKGAVVEVPVTEYANGRAYTENARFRAYGSYAEAFRDYANLLSNSPRYAAVLGQTDAAGFARSLQHAGYATDPMYADKLTRIIGGNTLRTALAG